jgi:hypothetical protein
MDAVEASAEETALAELLERAAERGYVLLSELTELHDPLVQPPSWVDEIAQIAFEQGMQEYPGGHGRFGTWGFDQRSYTPTRDYRMIWWDPEALSRENNEHGAYIEAYDGQLIAWCAPSDVGDLRAALEGAGLAVVRAERAWLARGTPSTGAFTYAGGSSGASATAWALRPRAPAALDQRSTGIRHPASASPPAIGAELHRTDQLPWPEDDLVHLRDPGAPGRGGREARVERDRCGGDEAPLHPRR